MKVNLNGSVYIVKWKHPEYAYVSRGTECTIKDGNSGIYGIGKAICSKNEQFVKDKGRKISLARALNSCTGVFKKNDRKVFWDEYLSLKK